METVLERSVPYKVELAKKVEKSLGGLAVSDLDGPVPIKFAHGSGNVTFGEFIEPFGDDKDVDRGYPRKALMYTYVRTGSGLRVGVCLFGSMRNYADYILDAENHLKEGWVSSSAPAVERFLSNRCTEGDKDHSREDLAREALKIADSQGIWKTDRNICHGWNRGFTFGDARDVAEWLAEIYFDCDLRESIEGPMDGIDRILIGAPYWLRTPSLTGVKLYSQVSGEELDAIEDKKRNRSRRSWMDRLLGRDKAQNPYYAQEFE